jgi:alpha-glucosidase
MNYFMIWHTGVSGILKSYVSLTGLMPMPPLWSLGYHQCRWSYFPESEMLSLAQNFRSRKIPCDVLWFDIHYMQDYKVFTWSAERFPNPKKFLGQLEQMGFRNVAIIDPGIKVEPGYAAYEEGTKKDLFLKYPDGQVWSGQVWPGWCTFTDYTKPEAREWWGNLFNQYIDDGLDGFWCDMNEIATWGQKTPNNLIFDYEGQKASHRIGKNIYGLQMTRATYEGTRKIFGIKRPFILTRAGFAGLQRYTAIWTGDNVASDQHMLLGVRLINSLGLSGVPFAGADVGGFVGNTSPALMARWISIGAFSPFFRSHKEYNGTESEPWAFGEDIENICRNYIQLRYNLMPYTYSTFHEASLTGLPVQRSLAIDYAFDEKIYQGHAVNQYLFGPSLLVVPNASTVQTTPVYLPEGDWYDFYSGEKLEGGRAFYCDAPLEKLPVFVKEGSFLFMQSPVQTTAQKPADTLFVHLFYSQGKKEQWYYEDAGDGFEFESAGFWKRKMTIDGIEKKITMEETEGNYTSHFRHLKIYLHGFSTASITANGTTRHLQNEYVQMIPGLWIKDPLGNGRLAAMAAQTFTIPNQRERVVITWQ